ncbi:acetylornithine deacetylase [Bacillus sp. SA1-12]|uniref:M20 family metallopeptidase n=1 Tax=Bacillus sp. SA1-12 TaxID=1455638 RepID=UPI0006257B68|nr:M20 family metallopeptidase [Bacillus sp. SA1-12]KKI92119.1 acetylornithine deacetylase [Bacillus sp. SA1-12]
MANTNFKDSAYFDSNELIEILCGLISKNSENPLKTEEAAAFYIKEILLSNGIETELSWAEKGRPNVLARLKGNQPGPTLLYNGHLDVVPAGSGWSVDPFAGLIRDGKVFGRGAADMKSGVAAMIYTAIILKRMGTPFAGELILFFNVDEERENIGMLHFLKGNITADYTIIGEPTELEICIAHKGVARYRLHTKGTSQHAAKVKGADNAIHKMAEIISNLAKLDKKISEKEDPLLGNGSLTITEIKGGTAPNMVPEKCIIEIDRRVLPGDTKESVKNEIRQALGANSKLKMEYELEEYLFLPASSIPKDHVLVENLAKVCEKVNKEEAKIKVFEATCEAPFFSVHKGIPTVIFGPGSLKQAHVIDEYVEVNELKQAAFAYGELALELLKSN